MEADLFAGETVFLDEMRARFDADPAARIGFGCAHLYGGRGRADALRIVGAAVESGITYFDTARLYGHGQSERILGEALAGQRDRVIIASKAGILPAAPSLAHRAISKASHMARKALPFIPVPTPVEPKFGVFAPDAIRASVETSLRELKTDYLDILLLHECGGEHVRDPELLAELDAMTGEGKIRAYGTATQPDVTLAVANDRPSGLKVLQFKNDIGDKTLADLPGSQEVLAITHSLLGRTFSEFLSFLLSGAANSQDLQILGHDLSDHRAWGYEVMAYAMAQNASGVVLFSSARARSIAKTATISALSGEKLEAMQQIVQAFMAARA